jgi:hypothetical protein
VPEITGISKFKITVKMITIIHNQLKSNWQCHLSSTTAPQRDHSTLEYSNYHVPVAQVIQLLFTLCLMQFPVWQETGFQLIA